MSAILSTILIEAATKVGAPIVKGLLERYAGGTAAEIGGAIIDAIAGHAGVAPEELPGLPAGKVEEAIARTEAMAPEILVQWNLQQKQAIELQRAEMDKAWWSWAWRPAWMWFLGFLFLWRLVILPVVDAALGTQTAGTVDLSILMTLTTWFLALYMGGHTVKALGDSAVEAVKSWRSNG